MARMIDKLLFGTRHWQLFLTFLALGTGSEFVGIQPNILGAVVYLIWLPLVGIRLKKFLPTKYSTHYLMFLAGWVILIIILTYSYFVTRRAEHILFVPAFFIFGFGADFTVFAFIARAMKSLQTRDRATLNDYFGDIFLVLLFFPVGIWFLQPRLNLLYEQYYRD